MFTLHFENGILAVSGQLNRDNATQFQKSARLLTVKNTPNTLDLSGLEALDSAGVASIEELIAHFNPEDSQLKIIPASPDVEAVRNTFKSPVQIVDKPPQPNIFEKLGGNMEAWFQSMGEALVLCSELFYWSIVGIFDRKGQRKGSFGAQGLLLGYNALPVVALLSFIIGFILSLQSAAQLKNYGGNVFLPDLLAITLVREMAPLITAIIVAGRSGSAIASEIATMQVSEEIDALRMMAINPIRYVVVPKFHAITVVMPLLVVFSIAVGELGGFMIATSMLDLSLGTFVSRSVNIIKFKDIFISLTKSTVFAWLIVIIGAYNGFRVRGGAEGVGKATTASVVAAIFAIVIADALFSLLYLL
ncbi:MAG: MlaE family lipid ABC transporter permease subunit [Candidatus Cloacimonetes bacterium]|nr:MlaE family lipid ABC transporter permease subunit [Candidatus Cloacimonadota bacterium]